MTQSYPLPETLKKYLIPAFERKAISITALDVSELTSYTDTLVIIEASSHRQVTSISQHIIKALKAKKLQVIGSEGVKQGEWALLDYGQIVIHVFEAEAKTLYDLEGFWADAPAFDLSGFDDTPHTEKTNG